MRCFGQRNLEDTLRELTQQHVNSSDFGGGVRESLLHLTPLAGHLLAIRIFVLLGEHIDLKRWQRLGVGKFTDLRIQDKFITIEYLCLLFPALTQYQYYQLKLMVATMTKKNLLKPTMMDF